MYASAAVLNALALGCIARNSAGARLAVSVMASAGHVSWAVFAGPGRKMLASGLRPVNACSEG